MSDPSKNLEILVRVPSGAQVVQDYIAGESEAVAFYGAHYGSLASYRAKASEVDGRFDREARERAVSAVIVPEGGDAERLRSFVEDGGYMVTTGQQPGLFGGPLYSVYKGLTAIALARRLEVEFGKPVIPLFWVASEDHDWDEANHTWLVGTDNELTRFSVDDPDPAVTPALHRIPLGSAGPDVAEAFLRALPPTDFGEPFAALVREASGADQTLPAGFHRLMHRLLGPLGLYFTDAAASSLKAASADVLRRELADSARHEEALTETAARLAAAEYGSQVTLMPGGVNLFLETGAGRERLYREGDGFRVRSMDGLLSVDDVEDRMERDAAAVSPNVLLRPVVESAVFPTLSYVGGPGETAYFAQLADFFECFGIGMPVIHPRFGATIVETKIRKVLDKFGVEIESLSRPFHEVAGEIARDEVPPGVKQAIGGLRGAIAKGVAELEKEARGIDPTLKGPVQHVRSQAFQALDEAERKVTQALKRENEVALAQLEKARLHLFPNGKPQERVMNPFYYLWRYGEGLLTTLLDRFTPDLD